MTKHCIDTSSLIYLFKHYPYSRKMWKKIWDGLFERADSGLITTPAEVFNEIAQGTDGLIDILKPYKDKMFVPPDTAQFEKMKEVLAKHDCHDLNKKRCDADPYILAYALLNKVVVVCDEGNGTKKLPHLCKTYGIPCINLVDFIDEMGLEIIKNP